MMVWSCFVLPGNASQWLASGARTDTLPDVTLLLVEDDQELARQLSTELAGDGYTVRVERDGLRALDAALGGTWDVIILDVMLPGLGGFELLGKIRERHPETPVLFLTARGDVADRVRGLSLGGDDYLTKPFSPDELKARLRALTRRVHPGRRTHPPLPQGWTLNPALRQVDMSGTAVSLQPREWSLLEFFLQHEGQVLTKSFLLDQVWGIRFDPGTNVVDAVVCRLRRKLDAPGKPSHITTLRGRGHVFHRDV